MDEELDREIEQLKRNYSARKSVLNFDPEAWCKHDMRIASIVKLDHGIEVVLGVGWVEEDAWRDAAYRLGLTNE